MTGFHWPVYYVHKNNNFLMLQYCVLCSEYNLKYKSVVKQLPLL